MGTPASAGIELGARVVTTQALPEGIPAGSTGTITGEAGWIQRRWRVHFDSGVTLNVPEYALDPSAPKGRFHREP
ncbi:MAG TPA: hypothetical protein VFZ00_04190 [Solirubrobacter sp.]|jgi:hypothetical protein|nr:hypothetical protein [Solirubrobacter sp.]